MVAKPQICKGSKWRIRDGNRVSISKDHWIRGMSLITTHASQENRGIEMKKVVELLNIQAYQWDVEKVTSYFEPHIAKEILKVNLLQEEQKDCLIQKLEKNGLFKVKSAYHFIKNGLETKACESSNGQRMRTLWKAIQCMRVPKKVQVMAWRACHDGFPSKSKLFKRKILQIVNVSYVNQQRKTLTMHWFANLQFGANSVICSLLM